MTDPMWRHWRRLSALPPAAVVVSLSGNFVHPSTPLTCAERANRFRGRSDAFQPIGDTTELMAGSHSRKMRSSCWSEHG